MAIGAALAARADQVVITDATNTLTAAQLLAEVERMAAGLTALGIVKGERVAVQTEKSLSQALLYLATLRVGAVFVPLNPAYGVEEVGYFLGDSQPALYVCDPAHAIARSPLAAGVGARLFTLDAEGDGSLAAALAGTHTPAPAATFRGDDPAVIIYTSGTTGRSKGALLSHRNLLANALALIHVWKIDATDVLVHALPLFHIHGLFVAFNTMLLAGGRVRWLRRFEPAAVVEALAGATLFMGVPTHYTRLLASGFLSRESVRTVRLFIAGSAPLLPQTFAGFERATGQRIVERYGMSECGIVCSNPVDGPRRPGSVGRPLPGVDFRIADERGEPVISGTAGGIEVRGDHVCSGYWRRPDRAATGFRENGYFMTGDVGQVDDDGYVHIVGRAKDFIITGGLNVYPREIELVLDALPGVAESAVIGLPHPDFGEAVVAVISATCGSAPPAADVLLAGARRQLANFKLPKALFFLDELPRNAMGKVQKAVLRERFAATFEVR